MNFRDWVLSGLALVFATALWCAWLWKPERQIRLHQRNLLRAFEQRNWEKAAGFLADNYSDRWGHDKGIVLEQARRVFQQFILLDIESEIEPYDVGPELGWAAARLRLQGRGGPVADIAVSRVNALQDPWRFRWVKQSGKPWDWALVWAEQPELEVGEVSF